MRVLVRMFAATFLSLPVVLPAVAADRDQPTLQLAQAGARGMSFDNYIRLRKGMSEGELRARAGTPDHQTIEAVTTPAEGDQEEFVWDPVAGKRVPVRRQSGTAEIARTYYYYATADDPFITTIKVLGGEVVDIKRERQF